MSDGWPRCTFNVTLGGMTLDCVRPQGHRFDGVALHLTSLGVEWSLDMAVKDLGRAQPGDNVVGDAG
jgi:hypothetical protein